VTKSAVLVLSKLITRYTRDTFSLRLLQQDQIIPKCVNPRAINNNLYDEMIIPVRSDEFLIFFLNIQVYIIVRIILFCRAMFE